MAGARVNNKLGGCGSAPEATLLPIARLTDQIGTQLTLARAVAFAANPSLEDPSAKPADGADVIVASLGPSSAADWLMTSFLEQAITAASSTGRGGLGVPILWAATNDIMMAEPTGLEPATSAVTGRRSNQLSYSRKRKQTLGATGLEPMTTCV
jgi:hypothetical protein